MSKISLLRSDVTTEEVSAVLRRELGSRYTVAPSMRATGFGTKVQGGPNTVLVAGNWLERANVELTPKTNGTAIDVSPGATYFGLSVSFTEPVLRAKCTWRWSTRLTLPGRAEKRNSPGKS